MTYLLSYWGTRCFCYSKNLSMTDITVQKAIVFSFVTSWSHIHKLFSLPVVGASSRHPLARGIKKIARISTRVSSCYLNLFDYWCTSFMYYCICLLRQLFLEDESFNWLSANPSFYFILLSRVEACQIVNRTSRLRETAYVIGICNSRYNYFRRLQQ